MSTKIVSSYDRFMNLFSKSGRIKNQMYKTIYDSGLNEIRERAISKDKFVLLASQNEKGRSSMTFGVDLKKGYIQKETGVATILGLLNRQRSGIVKYFTDWNGKLLAKLSKNKAFENGKTVFVKNITEIPERYTKISEINEYAPIRRSVTVDYANGNKYSFTEDETGNRIYKRTVNGVDYSFDNEK